MLFRKLKIIVPILMVVALGSAMAANVPFETQKAENSEQVALVESKNDSKEDVQEEKKLNKQTEVKQVTKFASASFATSASAALVLDLNDKKIAEALKDLRAAGYTEAEAMSILNNALAVNQKPRKIYEIASGFVDMRDVGIPIAVANRIFDMDEGIDAKIFRKEISTLISDLIDMNEVGISDQTAVAALFLAISADRSLREVSTIISGIIDLKESGVEEAALIARAKAAIAADPSLRKFDDHLGINWDDYDDKDDDYDSKNYNGKSSDDDKIGSCDCDEKYDDMYDDDCDDDYDDDDDKKIGSCDCDEHKKS